MIAYFDPNVSDIRSSKHSAAFALNAESRLAMPLKLITASRGHEED
jgi:hypothetical protein